MTPKDVILVAELYQAVYEMLVARVLHGQNSKEFLIAINRVIDAHDEIAKAGAL